MLSGIARPDRNDVDIPPMFPSLMHSLKFAFDAQPMLLVVSFVFTVGGLLPEALSALWLKVLLNGVTSHDSHGILVAAMGLALTGGAGWLMRTIGSRFTSIFSDRIALAVNTHVAKLQAHVSTVEHHERPEYLNRLQILRDHAFLLDHIYPSLMQYVGSTIRLLITVGLLMSIKPVLGLLVFLAVPTVTVSARRAGIERAAEERAAPQVRLARHFFELGTTPATAKELRVSRAEDVTVGRRRAAFGQGYAEVARQRWITATQSAAAWLLFSLAYIASVSYVAHLPHASAGNVVLTLAAGAALSRFLGQTVGQTEFLRWNIEAAQRLLWLERFVASRRGVDTGPAPERIDKSIRFDHVSFAYPGTDTLVLDDIDLTLPAGAVVAIVGENGAGKSTLTKLLSRLYDPTEGRILVDDTDLARIDPASWRERLAGAFQDFFKFEFLASSTVGLGDLPRHDERPAVETAVERGGATDVVEKLPEGLDTQLGPSWRDGRDLSHGQWQKLAVSRGFMRDRPLLCILDEPTAALDAETEHTLFERFAAASRAAAADGRITVLVSHRFSTVRMADLIVVLDGARVAEFGDHETLMAKRGLYAELFGIQAAGYR
ncbi:MAG TPA: ABC transporter ATP-binding protein [Acidimicrobiales bacterium]|nr:ABC transporter ATP-binding protein [Acidimicrobiales bacterium]